MKSPTSRSLPGPFNIHVLTWQALSLEVERSEPLLSADRKIRNYPHGQSLC